MTEPKPRRARPAWLILLACAAACAAGLALEFGAPAQPPFWIGDERGAMVLIGAAGAALSVAAGWLARLVLARREPPAAKG